MAKTIKLTISSKSTVVVNQPRIDLQIQRVLRRQGAEAQRARGARDLGVWARTTTRRCALQLRKRLKVVKSRLVKVAQLVKGCRRVRRPVRASPYAVVLSGIEATGMAHEVLKSFRAQVAGASSISASSRSATTAI